MKAAMYAAIVTIFYLTVTPLITYNEIDTDKKYDCQIYSNHEIHEYVGCHFADKDTIYWGD
jgi:folate-dependent tRNA-U54 methylase TrmFO/GidA